MESWDDEDFEPQVAAHAILPVANKWEGEDEEENVKESWEDEEEEEKPVEQVEVQSKPPKKKGLAEKIAEKERLKREEMEKKLKEQEEEISPEERLKRQKESDLSLALETTFGEVKNNGAGLDNFNPTTKEEFEEFAEALEKKVQPLYKSAEYPIFAENLIRSLCAPMSSFDIKKIKTTIDNLYLEKQKIEKGDKLKKNKGKAKARIKVEDENQFSAYVDSYDDYDDFM